MPTPSEQKALAFIASIILLGGAVRVVRAGSSPAPTAGEQQAVARQARAADSAAGAQASRKKGRTRRPKANDTLPVVVGGVSSVPRTFARPEQPYAKSPYGYPPPGPRIDVDYRTGGTPAIKSSERAQGRIDIDNATAAEIEKLPKIGPATARRIVANRDSLGAFGSLEALRRVKGLGPATLKTIAELVTFGAARR